MRFAAASIVTAVLLFASRVGAEEQASVDEEEGEEDFFDTHGNLRTRAETVSFDARDKVLELSGNVRVDSPPFHLRSQRIKLTRTKLGIEVEGNGRLAFCPCLGTPLTVEFEKAFVAPPGDLIIKSPTLEFYGVPIMHLPWFWLRSDEKLGVLPPDLAYRGKDGFFAGEGVHVPWKRYGKKYALDVRAGGYLFDGFATEAQLRTPASSTKVRFDRLRADDGLSVDARGATGSEDSPEVTTAWDVDMLRGQRGVRMTTDLDAAAKPWDRGSIESALRAGPFTVSQSIRAVTRRGERLTHVESAGPVTTLRASGALAGHVTYDATIEGGALRFSRANGPITPDTLSFARAEVGAAASANVGPFAGTLSARGGGDVVATGTGDGGDRAGGVRARVGVPLVRAYRSDDEPNDPLLHLIEPFVETAVLHASGSDLLGTMPGRGLTVIDGEEAVSSGGLATTLGHWGDRGALDASVAGGSAYGVGRPEAMVRGRMSASLAWFGATVDVADVENTGSGRGGMIVGRTRIGRTSGLRLLVNTARSDFEPVLARLLTDPALESPSGFLVRRGKTDGATLVIPWAHAVTTSAGVDVDESANELVAARGGIELRDRCGCVTVRANGSHRIGREGVDVWLSFDFAADR